jgi:tetratricopeptide (TPR) repeat protein
VAAVNKEKASELNTLALAAYSSGRIDKAIELWKKALEFDPEMQEAKVNLDRAQKERP